MRGLYKFYFIIFFILLGQVCVRCRVYCKDDACVCSAGCARGYVKGGFYLKLAQNIVFLFSSEMRGSTIRLYTDDRFYRKILKYK